MLSDTFCPAGKPCNRTVQDKGWNVILLPILNGEENSQVNACRLM